jgi:PAS domain S-box-containing protein
MPPHQQAQVECDRFFQLSLDMLCIANFDGYFLRINPAWTRVLGHTQAELLSGPYLDFIHPDDRSRTLAAAQNLAMGESTIEFENRYRCRDGSYRWLLWNATPCLETQVIYCIARDITERKQAQEELNRQTEMLQSIFDHIPIMITLYDAEGRIQLVNQELQRVLGWSWSEIQSLDLLAECYPDPDYRVMVLQHMLQPGQEGWQDFKTHVRDGRILDTSWANVHLSDGRMLGIGQDITVRKRSEAALRIAQENYRSIFANALNGIFQSTPDGHYLRVNAAMATLHGYESPERMLQQVNNISQQIYVDPGAQIEFQHLMAQYGQVKDFQYQVRRADGTQIWVEETTRAVRDDEGKILYYEGMVEDITQRKQQEERLRRQMENLQIQIDAQKRHDEVMSILETDYFRMLQRESANLRLDEP